MKEELLRRARLYQADDGTPGPLSYQWGWRDMSEQLRAVAMMFTDDSDVVDDSEIKKLKTEIRGHRKKYAELLHSMYKIRELARNRNPDGLTILDFMTVWNEQYCVRNAKLEVKNAKLEAEIKQWQDYTICPWFFNSVAMAVRLYHPSEVGRYLGNNQWLFKNKEEALVAVKLDMEKS